MKAIVLQEPLKFERRDIADPDQPGVGEALVKVHRVGICGSDVSGYLGKMPFFSYPRIPGHELGVEVLAVGDGVDHVQPGDRCSVEPYINCKECFACRRGGGHCCQNIQVLGVHRDGGLRERFVLPARKLHRSDKMTMEQLALVETLAIGCHCVNRADPHPGEHVLVVGAGPIGLSATQFLRLAGVTISVLDLVPERLDFCKKTMNVDHTIVFKGDGSEIEALREVTDGDMPSVVIDATGNARSMSNALNYVAPTGKLAYVGITTDEISFTHPTFHKPEMTLLASRNALPADFERIIRLIEDGKIDTRPWITHRTTFEELIDVFPQYTRPESGVIKAIVNLEKES